jgi:hypothetical protein
MEPFAIFTGHGSHVFREKIPNGNAENEVSMIYTSHNTA